MNVNRIIPAFGLSLCVPALVLCAASQALRGNEQGAGLFLLAALVLSGVVSAISPEIVKWPRS